VCVDGWRWSAYGDPAYMCSDVMQRGYPRYGRTPAQVAYNTQFNRARASVEWYFGRVVNLWPLIDFKPKQKLLLSPLAKQYYVACFLTNLKTICDGGNIISDWFRCAPPDLDEYLR
jgi:hypothetical protein